MAATQLAPPDHAVFSGAGDGGFVRAVGVSSVGRGMGIVANRAWRLCGWAVGGKSRTADHRQP